MKKTISILTVFILSLTIFCGCDKKKEYKVPTKQAVELQNEIMECFKKKDKEKLKSFFSKHTTDNFDLDKQIDEAFDFIDDEIVSYDEPFPGACGSYDEKNYGATTNNIITKKEIKYKIDFGGWLTNNKYPDKIGVIYIRVVNMTQDNKLPKYASEEEREKCRCIIGEY